MRLLAAPTASGKTAAALALAQAYPALGVEVICADALLGYRGFDVGTAKPSMAERAAVPHHLIDQLDPTEALDVASWTMAAERTIAAVIARGGQPLVVAGTGFYLDALERGLPSTPASNPTLRAALMAEWEERGIAPLYAELLLGAPSDAAASQGNPRRVLRALEVLRSSGKPPSAYPRRPARFATDSLVALPSVALQEERIALRLKAMLAAGWLAEVAGLVARVPPDAPAWQAIGYRELAAVVRGESTLADAEAAIILATRRYAKRQRTWFARRPANALRVEGALDGLAGVVEAWFLRHNRA